MFISWSGEASKAIAEVLRGWLPSVIQGAKPYYSPDDITKGSRWNTEIAKELEDCKVGLLCLTASNLEAPWIMFEAGALSKSLSAARVCPLLFGIEPPNIKGPLVQFQAAPFSKDEMKRVIRMINQELGPTALPDNVLDSVFNKWWPDLEERVIHVMTSVDTSPKQVIRSQQDIVEETLTRVRTFPASLSGDLEGIKARIDAVNLGMDGIRNSIDSIRSEAYVKNIGKPVDAYIYITGKFNRIVNIKNTHIKEEEPTVDLLIHLPMPARTAYLNGIISVLTKQGVVRDIVSTASVQLFKKYREEVIALARSGDIAYTLKEVDSKIPFINYTILEFDNGDREVLFGWAYHGEFNHDSRVFRSKDKDVVSYYDKHFEFISTQANRVQLN